MDASSRPQRRRLERGIYEQQNGKYAVCVMVAGRARFRTLDAATLDEARRLRMLLKRSGRVGALPLSPRLTFAEVAARWLAEFEAKVTDGARRERTLDLYRSQLRLHLLPRLGRRRLALISPDDVVDVMHQLRARGLSPWTVKRILGALSCVFSYALRCGYINSHPFDRLERDERPHPLPSDQRVLTQSELARLLRSCPRRHRPLLATGAYTGMRLSEVLALKWDDLDFAAGVIHVRHQLARGHRGAPHRIRCRRKHLHPCATSRSFPSSRRSCASTSAPHDSRPAATTCSRPAAARHSCTTTSPNGCYAEPPAMPDSTSPVDECASTTYATPSPAT